MTAAIIIGLTLLLAAGLTLLLLGLRGRRINDHPICRGCGFDLVGVLPAGSTCPECGAGIKSSRWVRIGARRKRVTWMLAGVVLSTAAFVPIGTIAWGWASGTDLNPHKPTMLLIWESQHASPKSLDPILLELAARWRAGTLSPDHKRRLVSLALANQRNLSRPWSEGWGDLFTTARMEKLPTDGEQMAFDAHSAIPKLRVQPETKPGRRIRYYLSTGESRQSSIGVAHLKAHVLSATLNGVPIQRAPDDGTSRPALWGVASLSPAGSVVAARAGNSRPREEWPATEWLVLPEDAQPGDAEIVLEVAVRTFRGSADPKIVQEVEANQQRAILRSTIKILQPDAAPVGVVTLDATSRTRLIDFFRSVTWESKPSDLKMIDGSQAWGITVGHQSSPEGRLWKGGPGLFADLFIVSTSGERLLIAELGTYLHNTSDETPSTMITTAPGSGLLWQKPLPDPLTVIFVLRPDRAREMDPPGEGYGGEEIVIENATVDR